MWIGTLDQTARHIERAAVQFEEARRPASFGLRTHLIARATEREAWDAADDLLSRAESVVREQRARAYAGTPMVGQRTQARDAVAHRLGPHLWNGISTVRVNCGTAIVGSYEQVAGELLAYWRLGIDEFILSGYPHVEECRRVASEVLPLLRSSIRDERAGEDTG